MKKCATEFCRNKADGQRYCEKCAKAKWRSDNPLKAAFHNLKTNAKRRGKEFSLTLADFEAFCFETNYISGKGKSKTSLTIDRIDNTRGYHLDNLRVITNEENARKHTKILVFDWHTPENTTVRSHRETENEAPF